MSKSDRPTLVLSDAVAEQFLLHPQMGSKLKQLDYQLLPEQSVLESLNDIPIHTLAHWFKLCGDFKIMRIAATAYRQGRHLDAEMIIARGQ